MRKHKWIKLWSAITGVALVTALILTFVPFSPSITVGGILSIEINYGGSNQNLPVTEPRIGEEVVRLRTENSKTYYLGNGQYQTKVFSGGGDPIYYSSASDGFLWGLVGSGGDYATLWSKTSADYVYLSDTLATIGQLCLYGYDIFRSFFYFDTSSIPSAAIITAASVNLYGLEDWSSTDFLMTVQNGQPTYPSDPLTVSDYNKAYYSGDGGSLSTSGFTTSGYNTINLNTDGKSWINKGGKTKFCIRSDREIAGTTPTDSEYVQVYTSEETGTGKDPYLSVTYVVNPKVFSGGDDPTYYSSASDGDIINMGVIYNTVWTATIGTIEKTNTTFYLGQWYYEDSFSFYVWRSFLYFDTSSIPAGASISAASLNLYGLDNGSDTDFNMVVQSGQPTYPHDPLVVGDYNKANYAGNGGSLSTSGFTTSGYNTINLNANGMSWITKAGATKLCVRSSRDIAGTQPTGAEYVGVYASEQSDTGYDPYLSVTYTSIVAPTVTTQAATDIASTSCTGNGNITATGGENCNTRGFCYKVGTSGDPTTADSKVYDNGGGSYGTGTYSKSITGLTPSTGYRVRAYAINSAGTGYDGTVQVTTLPGDPSSLTDTAHGGTSIDLSWAKGTGADYTLIRYRTDQYPTGTSDGTQAYLDTGTSTSVGSLSYGQIYYFRAWAYNTTTTLYSSGTSDKSAFTDPNAPTAFTVTERTSNSIALGWTKGTGADKTRVQYRTDQYPTTYSDGTQAYFDTGTSTNVTSLDSGQIYYFRAWSYDTESGYYDSYAQLTDYTSPADPSALNASNPTTNTIDVSWTKGIGGDKTMVRYKTGTYPTSISDGTQLYFDTGTSQQATELVCNTTYYFRAWSYDSDSTYYSTGYSSDTETTLTPALEITNLPTTYGFGILAIGTTGNTAINYFTLNNTGNCAVDVTIQGTDVTGGDDTWTLSGTATPGENIYGLYAGLDDADDNFDVVVNTTANAFVADLPEATTQAWGLKIYMPTSLSGYDAQQMTGTITLVVSAS